MIENHTAPVITYDQDILCDLTNLDEETLLQGVKAEDEKDGDVSDTLRVAQIIEPEDDDWIIVVYVAKDHDNNIAKKNRWVNLRTGESSENNKTI